MSTDAIDATLCRVRMTVPNGATEDRWLTREYAKYVPDVQVYAYVDVLTGRRFAPSCVTEIREGRVRIEAVEVEE
jgi:hypothetical protein